MKKVFIDGHAGTTGLVIREILIKHGEVEIVEIEEQHRKNINKKKDLLKNVDLAVLCLPDDAARETAKEIPQNVKVIDTSTAHRTSKGWIYGFPELKNSDCRQRGKIGNALRVANPGCHATGAISIIRPLITENVVNGDYPFFITSITGYSGAGKKMIQIYEERDKNDESWVTRPYSLQLKHKHIPEIIAFTMIKNSPIFYPILGAFKRGMLVSVGLENRLLKKKITAKDIHDIFEKYYDNEKFIKILPFNDNSVLASAGEIENAYLTATNCNNTNNLEILIFGNDEQTIIFARFDNLGKGASGAAIQNLNIMLGFDEKTGL
ncbi:MAG: N-acetyl-gamma-glutamyl-phosphate reductase [Chitinispirillales bacterium]|jgi:N-acetyl-gamma-glutamyl-phosphate reductase|nr:N-acetyl-gamma-glutamyl-phosphate reductase [Chitinispirillales bacterium]